LQAAGINFTCTGTLGLQAALLGLKSVVTDGYYTNEDDFILLRSPDDISGLVATVDSALEPADLPARQTRIVSWLLRGSFDADFFSFKNFRADSPSKSATDLGQILGHQIRALGPDGEDWHRQHFPAGGGNHSGSPLN